jgi:hypothetical protein
LWLGIVVRRDIRRHDVAVKRAIGSPLAPQLGSAWAMQLILVASGTLITLMLHGNRDGWFDSPTVCLLALATASLSLC